MAARRGWGRGEAVTEPRIGEYAVFDYPKLHGLRPMATLPIVDRLLAHTVIARIGSDIELALSDRMYGNRLAKTGARWALRRYNRGYGAYRLERLASLAEKRWPFTCITDLHSFYPSISRDLMVGDLSGCTKNRAAVAVVAEQLATWQDRDGLEGLPIGDPAFGVLASAVLAPIDRVLQGVTGDRHSYSDDITFFTASEAAGDVASTVLTETVAERGLALNGEKTDRYTDPEAAIAAISNEALDYVDFLLHIYADLAQEKVHDVWDDTLAAGEITTKRQLTNIHFGLSKMGSARDMYGMRSLIARLDILQAEPRRGVNYLLAAAPNHTAVYEVMLRVISDPVTPTNQALTLHALRFMDAEPRTDALLAPCQRIVENQRLHPLVRSWAAIAMRRAPAWNCVDTLERAEAERNYSVRRALLGSTRGSGEHPLVRKHLLEDIQLAEPDLAATCEYALRAA